MCLCLASSDTNSSAAKIQELVYILEDRNRLEPPHPHWVWRPPVLLAAPPFVIVQTILRGLQRVTAVESGRGGYCRAVLFLTVGKVGVLDKVHILAEFLEFILQVYDVIFDECLRF